MVEYRFRSLNETAVVESLGGRENLIRLEYANPFYGSCSLRLRLVRLADGCPWVDPDSIHVETCETRKADPKSLLSVAQRCLLHMAAQNPEILGRLSPAAPGGRLAAWLPRLLHQRGLLRLFSSRESEDSAHKAPLA